MDQAEKLRNVVKQKKEQRGQNARVITVTSGKGGVGKSNVAVNLAVQLQKRGLRVLVFDADLGLANIEVMFGVIPQYNLSDLIYHGKGMRDIISEGPNGIGFISSGNGIAGMSDLTQEQTRYLARSLRELDQMADVILVDTGAGISSHVLEFVVASPEVILVTTPEPSAITDAYSLLKALYRNPRFHRDETRIGVLVNRVSQMDEGRQVYEKLSSVVGQFLQGELSLIGTIPQDGALERAVRQQKTVSICQPQARSARAFQSVAAGLMGGDAGQPEARGGITRFFYKLWNQNS